MSTSTTRTAGVLLIIAYACVVVGCYLIWPPLAWIAGGMVFGLTAYAVHRAGKEVAAERAKQYSPK